MQTSQVSLFKTSVRSTLIAIRTILKPRYLRYFAVILVLNTITFIATTALVAIVLQFPLALIVELLDTELSDLARAGFNIVFVVAGLLSSVILFPTVSIIVSSPIYDRMVGTLFAHLDFAEGKHSGVFDSIIDSLVFAGKKIVVSLVFIVLSFVINLIPILGQIAYILGLFGNVIVLNGIDTFIPSFDRDQKRFRGVLKYVFTNPALWPFLFIAGSVNAIPIVNLVTIPISVLAGVFIYVEYNQFSSPAVE